MQAVSRRPLSGPRRWARHASSPAWLARLLALLGLVSLVSALTPSLGERLAAIREVLPHFAPAAARAGTAATGLVLLFLARGLRRRKSRAWWAAVTLSGLAAVLHLVKGLDVEEATFAGVVLLLLVAGRRDFVARPDPRSTRTVLWTAGSGLVLATSLGWLLLTLTGAREAPGTSAAERLEEAVFGLIGIPGPVRFVTQDAADRAAVTLLILGAAGLLTALGVMLRPAGGPHTLTPSEEEELRALIAGHGRVDSLSYFALRRDRSVIFSRSRKAAVSYRVVGGVSLAGGDPIGDPEAWPAAISAWLEETTRFGWCPAVLGASTAGANAYHRAGFDAVEIGDEAVIEVDDFGLDGRRMRPVRQAVRRVERAGYRIRCDRVAEVGQAARDEAVHGADAWRNGATERGFSMALGRFQDPQDDGCVMVRALDGNGRLRALMHFVPWGPDGLSLDLMRRDRSSENGTVEAMVAGLVSQAPRFGVTRLSLNFAVFRSVFERGERLGAGPVLRVWHAVLLQASRFWQIEALYRANAKYHPLWQPRYLCFVEARDLPRIGLVALRAEAFLRTPSWATLSGRRRASPPTSDLSGNHRPPPSQRP
ncbi:MAG TPA: phosphatidylglycerol lysyltransferase domain-containing protein [Intrasporangium sp.]|uniref:phosphatidylglycerol lysyltransferase domain-containing protein n=1 Tax=Intrasporangium sp. TaxID=1925024 RepID=UPI002D76EE95|nr:phosphatidylglycerol lysyltransferase domain-containing protein [Intrasporangium sp.]HET7397021.1 phosphatidylglycerol lysyltransferase domain-containing protein [Intrasporangium sp.]